MKENTLFEDRERKVGIKVTDIVMIQIFTVSNSLRHSVDVQHTNADIYCCICAIESKSMHKEKELPYSIPSINSVHCCQ